MNAHHFTYIGYYSTGSLLVYAKNQKPAKQIGQDYLMKRSINSSSDNLKTIKTGKRRCDSLKLEKTTPLELDEPKVIYDYDGEYYGGLK